MKLSEKVILMKIGQFFGLHYFKLNNVFTFIGTKEKKYAKQMLKYSMLLISDDSRQQGGGGRNAMYSLNI